MAVYRIFTYKTPSTVRIGDPEKGQQQAKDILFFLAGLIEKQDLLTNYPKLGIETINKRNQQLKSV
jgi:hypothetical protein